MHQVPSIPPSPPSSSAGQTVGTKASDLHRAPSGWHHSLSLSLADVDDPHGPLTRRTAFAQRVQSYSTSEYFVVRRTSTSLRGHKEVAASASPTRLPPSSPHLDVGWSVDVSRPLQTKDLRIPAIPIPSPAYEQLEGEIVKQEDVRELEGELSAINPRAMGSRRIGRSTVRSPIWRQDGLQEDDYDPPVPAPSPLTWRLRRGAEIFVPQQTNEAGFMQAQDSSSRGRLPSFSCSPYNLPPCALAAALITHRSSLTGTSVQFFTKTMSTNTDTTTDALYHFAVWAPDYTDADCLNRRLEHRTAHLAAMQTLVKAGTAVAGGSFVDEASLPDSVPVAEQKMQGSLMVFRARSIAEVRGIIEADVYWVGNVWNKETLGIRPIACRDSGIILTKCGRADTEIQDIFLLVRFGVGNIVVSMTDQDRAREAIGPRQTCASDLPRTGRALKAGFTVRMTYFSAKKNVKSRLPFSTAKQSIVCKRD
ncbi:hypothetical protein EVG20_g8017 [Dentipellis fragilis]|uniref:YCII-related domain-containing protein n=1 Tax=Dentipellis fragilis TaxID=205917 RepID=A0A4Y9YB30_9AGAM|nr:hypothetical protein EVG20_g8017 [Dentipellis fragilis]